MARNKYPEETIARILAAAQHLFLEKGYEHTTIQDIVSELGDLTKGAIYHHFKSKEDILYAVMDQFYEGEDEVVRKAEAKGQQAPTGIERLKMLMRATLFFPGQEKLFRTAPDLLKNPHILAGMLENNQAMIPGYVFPAVEQAVQEGDIVTDYPLEYCEAIIVLANVWLNPLIFPGSRDAFARRVACFREITRHFGADILDDEAAARICYLHGLAEESRAENEAAQARQPKS